MSEPEPSARWGAVGAAAMAVAIGTGAFGAHGLSARLDAVSLGRWQTAVEYHVYHALGLVLLAALAPRARRLDRVGWSFVTGLVLFCGSLYAMALTGATWLGAITPFGGVAFILGWTLLAVALARRAA